MRKCLRNQSGVTLVEVMVSVVLVSMVLVSVVAIVAQSAVYSKNVDMIYLSSNLARKRMDSLKLLSFADLSMQAPESDTKVGPDGEPDPSGDFLRTTEIEEDHSGNPYLMRVEVSVDRIVMGERSGSPVTIETLFADVE
ncbi:MAG: hypothetical protein GF408_03400 [Candidatus Omnitrophica bacterium]|nr:hypothetical protein [Candidatus Omnitrophota bacterium]